MRKQQKDYSIGLDIGTGSVGWAVIYNDNFKVMRKGNKKLWGARLFEGAVSAEARRQFRSTRRRYDRRRVRIKQLQELFNDEINKIDKNFYQKLKESFYREDDTLNKTIKITEEEKQQIKKYNEKYPTIYHLRQALMTNNEKMDIRLVYLGLHHIIKYRGNFNQKGDTFNVENLNVQESLKETFENLININKNLGFDENNIELVDYQKLEHALIIESKNDKKLLVKQELKPLDNKDFINEFTNLMVGNKANVTKMFNLDNDKISIEFKGSTYEDKYSELEKDLKENIEVVDSLKQIYDMVYLKQLFGSSENTNISALMISKYNKHKEDLRFLKDLLKINRKEYNKIFRTNEKYKCTYDKYISNALTYKDFITELNKSINNTIEIITDKKLKDIYKVKQKEIEEEKFMPRITDSDNGKYPYQLNNTELRAIIKNQGKFYPFLLEEINGTYKIEKLLTFRIPYYVGPLNNTTDDKNKQNPNAWMKRKIDNVKITPYNFEEVVDLDSSAEKFIMRMIGKCTYLLTEPSTPSNSILYSKYKVYNELKQIKVNDEKLTPDLINKIYSNLFLKTNKTVTEKLFIDYLKTLDEFSMIKDFKITGYSDNNKFANNMKPYVDFFGETGIFQNTNYTIEDAEEIINWITIFEDKKILERKVKQKYTNLNESQVNQITSKRYTGWSNLSKKLLKTKYYVDKETNQKKSIMDLLIETNKNFMQIINDKKYNFQKMIDEFNTIEDNTKLNYSIVEELATSPAVKRGIYQALKIVKELVDYIGYEPKNIMVEMARGEEEKKRTQSRKNKLLEYYKNSKTNIENYDKLYKELNNTEEQELNKEKLYLYFLQEGKSLYSRRPLNIEDLDKYEVDHIIPRTLIKDNSFDNKALVLREENQLKAASFILPQQFRTKENIIWWEQLKKKNMLSDKKLNNLKRFKYSEEDIQGFINRQIVETRQITKHVANILNNFYKNTKVIYLKASFSSDFRQKFEIFKFRNLNDYHHAHDAYLAATLGYYKEKTFKGVDYDKLKKDNYENYQNGKYKYDKRYGYIINNIDPAVTLFDKETGEVLIDNNEFISTVTNTLYNNDILISKKTEIDTSKFYDETIYKKGTNGIPLKDELNNNYGVYKNINQSYFVLVEYIEKEKAVKKLLGIPIYVAQRKSEEYKINYIKTILNITENQSVKILKDKIPFNVMIEYKNQLVYLRGASEICNAYQLKIPKEKQLKWKYVLNDILNKKENPNISNYEEITNEILEYLFRQIKTYPLFETTLKRIENYFHNENPNLEEKKLLIEQIISLYGANSNCANLKNIEGFVDRMGRLQVSNIAHGKLIYKSVTGIKEDTYEF